MFFTLSWRTVEPLGGFMTKTVEIIVRRRGPSFAPVTGANARSIEIEMPGSAKDKAPYPPHNAPVRLVRISTRSPRKGQVKKGR